MEKTLFRRQERLLVEEKFLDTAAYEFLEGACKKVMNECRTEGAERQSRLHPAELFYQCFFILDTLKSKSPTKQVAYCDERVWDDILFYLNDNDIVLSLADQQLTIGCIMQGAAELLLRAGKEHLSVVAALKRQIQRHAPQTVTALDSAYRSALRSTDEQQLVSMMTVYMKEERMMAEEINTLLDDLQQSQPAPSESAAEMAAGSVSSVRIAPKKKTSVLVVLNAMYKAKWFVDEDGNELKNRDAALNDILRHAFDVEKPTKISQTIKPIAQNDVDRKNALLLRRLLDKDEMESFIKEMQEELLEAYRDKEEKD